MSVIQTIRSKYGKIAGAIIALALVGFIISDARNGTWGSFFGGRDTNVMVVNGTKIDPREYQQRVKEYETLYAMYNKNRPLDDQTRAQMNEQVVQSMVYEAIVDAQCDKLGIITTEDEKNQLIYSENAHPMIRQFQLEGQQIFINQQTGQFDPSIIKQFEKAITEDPGKNDPTGKYKEQWETVKSYVRRNTRIDKFNSLYAGSSYIPTYSLKRAVEDQASAASIRYVKVPYTTVSDNDVKVTDDDIKAYIEKHAAMYTTDQPTRSIEYISFDILPSSADSARVIDGLNQVKADLASSKDSKTFANSKSDDINSNTEAFLNKRTFMSRYADTILSQPVGSVYGPYFENGAYKLTKIVERKSLPDSIRIKQIIVITKSGNNDVRTDTAASQKLDSAITAIGAGSTWDSAAATFSDDPNGKQKGGEVWISLLQLPDYARVFGKDFSDFVTGGKPGEKKRIKFASTNNTGYSYISIEEQKSVGEAEQLATISKNLVPSDSTVNAIYGKANEFAGKNPTAAEFDATVKKLNLDKRVGDNIKQSNFSIPGLGPAREIVRWSFDHKVGEISGVFQLGDQRYVVAKLVSAEEKGLTPVTSANRPMLEQKVKEEKKADLISKKYGGSGSVDAIASASGQQAMEADTVVLGAGFVPGLGYEPKVVGYAFSQNFQPNTLSPGIKGQGGVYFITVLKRAASQVDPNAMQMMMAQQRYQQEGQQRNAISQMLQQSLIKKANVKYNVDNF
jgi:peptidyl-prolyl cis-trans isomerase D